MLIYFILYYVCIVFWRHIASKLWPLQKLVKVSNWPGKFDLYFQLKQNNIWLTDEFTFEVCFGKIEQIKIPKALLWLFERIVYNLFLEIDFKDNAFKSSHTKKIHLYDVYYGPQKCEWLRHYLQPDVLSFYRHFLKVTCVYCVCLNGRLLGGKQVNIPLLRILPHSQD